MLSDDNPPPPPWQTEHTDFSMATVVMHQRQHEHSNEKHKNCSTAIQHQSLEDRLVARLFADDGVVVRFGSVLVYDDPF
jgi:hypothetical protein